MAADPTTHRPVLADGHGVLPTSELQSPTPELQSPTPELQSYEMPQAGLIEVQLARYTAAGRPAISRHLVAQGCSVAEFLDPLGLRPESWAGVSIYGRLAGPEAVLHANDRVELLPPLIVDPMTARRRRAEHRRKQPSQADPNLG